VAFAWDDLFGEQLTALVATTKGDARVAASMATHTVLGALSMLHSQPLSLADAMKRTLDAAGEGFELDAGQIEAQIHGELERMRQQASQSFESSMRAVMRPVFEAASNVAAGAGIKQRMLDILKDAATQHAPTILASIRQDVNESLLTVGRSLRPQLTRIVEAGERLLRQIEQNASIQGDVAPADLAELKEALRLLPEVPGAVA